MFEAPKSVKWAALSSIAGVIILLQFILPAALDLVTSCLLFGVGYAAGRWAR